MRITYNLANATNLFGKNGSSGERARKSTRRHNGVVKQCLIDLRKKGWCLCWYEEQMHDIQEQAPYNLKVQKEDGEIYLEVV